MSALALTDAWNAFWFAPGSAHDLAIVRIAVLGYFLVVKLTDRAFDFTAWAETRARFIDVWRPPWLIAALRIPLPTPRTVTVMARIYRAAIFCAAIGLATPVSCLIAFALGIPLLGMRHGLRVHNTVIPIHFCLLAFALSGAGDALSVDAWLGHPTHDPRLYGWGLALIRVVIATALVVTGVAKLRHAGARWFHPDNLSDLMRIHDYPYVFVRPAWSISRYLYRFPWIAVALSAGVLVTELGMIVPLFWPPARYVCVPAAASMLIGFRLFLGARFELFVVIAIAAFFV